MIIEAMALFSGQQIQIALSPVEAIMALLALAIATINLHDGEPNAIEGMAHFVIVAAFLMLAGLGV